MSDSGDQPPAPKSAQASRAPRRQGGGWHEHPLLVGIVALVAIGAVVGGVLIWVHTRHYESTDDAFIDGWSQQVSAQVPGRVIKLLVDDNQDVKAGQPLVELDPADYQARLQQARAGVAQARAQLAQARAQEAVCRAQIAEAKANLDVAAANRKNAEDDLRRYENLRKARSGAVSPQQLDRTHTAVSTATAQAEAADRAVAAAQAQLGYAQSQIEAAQAAGESAEAQRREAELNLSYTEVKARVDGRVANRTVAEGNYAQPGVGLMMIVPREVYVTANFKETQLRRMRRGQRAEVKVDAYPDLPLEGHVDSFQPATGQAFSVLPAENATGNWVKVVQRLPVKIVFEPIPDDSDRRLSPGMSVVVKISVR